MNFANGVLRAGTSLCSGYPRRVELIGSQSTLNVEHDQLAAVDFWNALEEFQSAAGDQKRRIMAVEAICEAC